MSNSSIPWTPAIPPGSYTHWDSPGKNNGVGCCALLQGIFPTQDQTCVSYILCTGRRVLYHQRHLGSPDIYGAFNSKGHPERCQAQPNGRERQRQKDIVRDAAEVQQSPHLLKPFEIFGVLHSSPFLTPGNKRSHISYSVLQSFTLLSKIPLQSTLCTFHK